MTWIRRKGGTIAVALVAVGLAVGLFGQTVYNYSHNEQMYVTAGYLVAQGKRLYQDFAFVQMPYVPLLYAPLFRLTGGYFLLTAKLINYTWTGLTALLLYMAARRWSRDPRFSLTVVVVFLSNYYITRATMEASNYTLPMALSLLGGLLMAGAYCRGAVRGGRLFLAGVALGGAIGGKLYYASLVAPCGLVALLYPRQVDGWTRLRRGVLPLAGGLAIGLGPVWYYLLRDPDRFLFNNLGYHTANTLWRVQSGFLEDTSLWGKLGIARDVLANSNVLPLVLWLALAGWFLLDRWQETSQDEARLAPPVAVAGLMAITAALTAFTPSPLFPQYFAMPVPFLLLTLAALQGQLSAPQQEALRRLALVVAAISVLIILPRHAGALQNALDPDEPWSGVAAHHIAHAIRGHLEQAGLLGGEVAPKVATLSPVYAIEAGLGIYPQLATGSFVYRIGDLLSPAERERYVATSPSTLHQLLDSDPPVAILVTQEGELETPLLEYAQSRGYEPAAQFSVGQLFIR